MGDELTILESMKKLGFSEYEIKAYLSLLKEYPVNGYTLSKNSGIPRSRIYEVLENLKGKQLVFEETSEKSVLYHPLEPELLIQKVKKDFEETIKQVEMHTQGIYQKKEEDNRLTIIKGREAILNFIVLLIDQAEKRIAVSIWEEELIYLQKAIDRALTRGVLFTGVFFGENNPYSQLCSHRRIERYLAEKKERYLIVLTDYKQVVSGVVSRGAESQVTWTKDIGFLEVSEDYIVHDISLNKLLLEFPEEKRDQYELFLDNLRKDYFGFGGNGFVTLGDIYK